MTIFFYALLTTPDRWKDGSGRSIIYLPDLKCICVLLISLQYIMQTMFSQTWRRSQEVSLPAVWCRFGRTNKDGEEFKFSIQTATDEHHDEMLDIMVKYFLKEAAFKATSG